MASKRKDRARNIRRLAGVLREAADILEELVADETPKPAPKAVVRKAHTPELSDAEKPSSDAFGRVRRALAKQGVAL